jgi:hypothetical protein
MTWRPAGTIRGVGGRWPETALAVAVAAVVVAPLTAAAFHALLLAAGGIYGAVRLTAGAVRTHRLRSLCAALGVALLAVGVPALAAGLTASWPAPAPRAASSAAPAHAGGHAGASPAGDGRGGAPAV